MRATPFRAPDVASGMGKVVGGILGSAVGLGSAMGIGAAAGIVAIPGVGPVTVLGMLGLGLLTLGGTAAGLKVGDMIDDRLDEGLPVDELYVYEDALRRGRSIVIALAEDDEEAEQARAILTRSEAETVDAARDQWWIGLRSAEQEAYRARPRAGDSRSGGARTVELEDAHDSDPSDWNGEESAYRAGFEAALLSAARPPVRRDEGLPRAAPPRALSPPGVPPRLRAGAGIRSRARRASDMSACDAPREERRGRDSDQRARAGLARDRNSSVRSQAKVAAAGR